MKCFSRVFEIYFVFLSSFNRCSKIFIFDKHGLNSLISLESTTCVHQELIFMKSLKLMFVLEIYLFHQYYCIATLNLVSENIAQRDATVDY